MHRIDKRPEARSDLIEIWSYTLDCWGEQQADDYLRLIDDAIRRLEEHPLLGADYSHVREGIRRLSAGRHRILYRVSNGAIEIVRVLHASQDIHEHLARNEN